MQEPFFERAARQAGVVTRGQLLADGYTEREIHERVRAGWFRVVTPGAYCVASTPITRRQFIAAEVLLHPDGCADAVDATTILGLDIGKSTDTRVRIALPHATRATRPTAVVRRQLHRTDADIVDNNGVATVSPARLIIDMAGRWPPKRVAWLFDVALRAKLVDVAAVQSRHAELARRGRKGVAVIDELLSQRSGNYRPLNGLEQRAFDLIVNAGLPVPTRQYKVVMPDGRERFIDLAYPPFLLGFETDGYEFHFVRSDWASDQVRSNELVAVGWRLFHLTDEILDEPEEFLSQVRSLLANPHLTLGTSATSQVRDPPNVA